ncbi:MAG: glycosyltransferase family 2 protein [Halobacteriaceae archaeon]
MELSVVVPTLNGRAHLEAALDAVATRAPHAEVVVVNGPSTDGTGGLVRSHEAPDRRVEVAERNPNVARNAGIEASTGDAVAFVGQASALEPGWTAGVREALGDGADAVTGPVHHTVNGGVTTATPERTRIARRDVTFFDAGNVALTRAALDALDGFDEYLSVGGARDVAHRLAALDRTVAWHADVAVLRAKTESPDRLADPDAPTRGVRYRCLAYCRAKNYGLRPSVATGTVQDAAEEAMSALRDVFAGEGRLSSWLGTGRDVLTNLARGAAAGLRARATDRSAAPNPHGVSSRRDRAVVTQSH